MESDLKFKEQKYHEALYNNIFLLTKFYPTSKDFNEVFQKDMFLKNNKTAFHQVVYYLLNILNPKLTREKITCWPPYEVRRENKFRNEVLKYINELKDIYENADIPHIMASQLISPGGYKFIVFIFKLSVLVLREHLRKYELKKNILFPIKANKNPEVTKKIIATLRIKINNVLGDLENSVKNFGLFYIQSSEEARKIMVDINSLNKTEKAETTEEINVSSNDISKKLSNLKKKVESFEQMGDLSKKINELLSFISNKNLILEHNKDDLKLPKSIEHLVKNTDTLNLIELFGALKVFLEHGNLELPNYPSSHLDRITVLFEEIIAKYERVNKQLDEKKDELKKMYKEDQKKIDEEILPLGRNSDSLVGYKDLAMPLEPSTTFNF